MSSRVHPHRVDHFKKWASAMVEAAQVPENVRYLSSRAPKGRKKSPRRRRKRFRNSRKRNKLE